MTSQAAGATRVREEFLEPVRRTLSWLLTLRDREGRIVCPEHGIEHTGKSACAAITAAVLARLDVQGDRERWRAAAIEQGRRLVANLVREGTSECHTFRPGRYDPFNNSNHVIDGGACSDALAELVMSLGGALDSRDREAFARASLLHARTYLRYAALDKGIPAQRAWGLTGLAAAWTLERDPVLESAGLEAIGALEAIQNEDGSFPYHPLEGGALHAGSSDVSAFYQSRVTGFTIFALERLGRDPRDPLFAPPIAKGLRFLLALQGPDGIKCGLVEAKPWYWGASYEVASHPFDVYTLARGWAHFRERPLATGALRSFRAWAAHVRPDGIPQSHFPAPGRTKSYQCPLFWASHACWLARSLEDLESAARAEVDAPRSTGRGIDLAVRAFSSVALARLEDDRVVAWVRGARPPFNVHHGSPHGGGLLRVVRKSDGAELVERERLELDQEAEWSGASGMPDLARGWRSGSPELRFSLWLARHHWRGRRYASALGAPFETFGRGVLGFASSRVSSAFALDAELSVFDDGVRLRSGLAWRGGDLVRGASIERVFEVDGAGLAVTERLLEPGRARSLDYRVPRAATSVEGAGTREIRYRLA